MRSSRRRLASGPRPLPTRIERSRFAPATARASTKSGPGGMPAGPSRTGNRQRAGSAGGGRSSAWRSAAASRRPACRRGRRRAATDPPRPAIAVEGGEAGWKPAAPLGLVSTGQGHGCGGSAAGAAAHRSSSPLQGSGSGSAEPGWLGHVLGEPVAARSLRAGRGGAGSAMKSASGRTPCPRSMPAIAGRRGRHSRRPWPGPRRRG